MQGRPLTQREKAYTKAHYARKFPSEIAADLSRMYPEDNDGKRGTVCIKRYRKKLEAERKQT